MVVYIQALSTSNFWAIVGALAKEALEEHVSARKYPVDSDGCEEATETRLRWE